MQSSNRAVVMAEVRRNNSKRVGPLVGWAWRDARCAVQFGKRQGAYGVELRPGKVRYLFDACNTRK